MSSTPSLHFNAQLLFQEMTFRGIHCEICEWTSLIKATFRNHKEYIDGAELSLMPSNYKIILDSKWNTKMLLTSEGFSTPRGYKISGWQIHELEKALEHIRFPIVMKPEFGTHGYEVRMNIENAREAKEIFQILSREIQYRDIIIEEQFFGNEFRITLTQNGFFGVLYRSFPEVIGNGIDSIEKLVKDVNKKREMRTNALCRIYIDNEMKRFLTKQGKSLEYIPQLWEKVIVRHNSNVSTWGGCHEITDLVHPYYCEIAQKILWCFPKLPYIGVDLMTQDITQKWEYSICELNPSPGISLHTHPESGQKKDLPKYLIDLLFPETISSL